MAAVTEGPLHASLLQGRSGQSGAGDKASDTGKLIRRVAGSHGPHPTIVLTVLLALASCACFADRRIQRQKSQAAIVNFAAVGGPSFAQSDVDGEAQLPLLLLAGAMMAGLLAGQQLCERYISSGVKQAFADLGKRLGMTIDLGRLQVWTLLGQLSVRNCSVRGHGNVSLAVHTAKAEVAMFRLACSGASDLHIQELRLDGVDISATTAMGLPTSLEVPSTHRRLVVGKVVLSDVALRPFVGGPRKLLADMRFEDFSEQMNARTMDEVFAAILRTVAAAAKAADDETQPAMEERAQ